MRKPFTLIELLVTITIISILAGILLPALSAARTRAKRTNCLSNMRQMAQAMISYIVNHDGYLPCSTATALPSGCTRYSFGVNYVWRSLGVESQGMLYESGELTNPDLFWGCTEPYYSTTYGDYSNKNPKFETAYGWGNWKVNFKDV